MTTTDSIAHWITAWFEKRNPGTEIVPDANYYEAGYVDSFGIIELIEVIEEKFAIRFSDDDFKLSSFRTIVGVTKIIERRRSTHA